MMGRRIIERRMILLVLFQGVISMSLQDETSLLIDQNSFFSRDDRILSQQNIN